MVRTKHTAHVNPDVRPQGEIARFEPRERQPAEPATFEPREFARMPNMYACRRCDRRFSNISNLNRHERQTHGTQLFKYPCPASPGRSYARRCDLREHYRIHHPEADLEEIDEVEAVEIPKETLMPTTPGESSASAPGGPRKKVKTKVTTTKTSNPAHDDTSTDNTSNNVGLGPLSSGQLNAISSGSGNRLVLIKEKITIEREYQFQQ